MDIDLAATQRGTDHVNLVEDAAALAHDEIMARSDVGQRWYRVSTKAFVYIDGDGGATLHLGHKPVDHVVDSAAALRVLLDYAATLDTPLSLTTTLTDGVRERYQLHPDGRTTTVPLNAPVDPDSMPTDCEHWAAPREGPSRLRRRLAARASVLVSLLLAALAISALLVFAW